MFNGNFTSFSRRCSRFILIACLLAVAVPAGLTFGTDFAQAQSSGGGRGGGGGGTDGGGGGGGGGSSRMHRRQLHRADGLHRWPVRPDAALHR